MRALLLGVLACCLGAARAEEISLWPQGVPEPRVPADPAEVATKGKDGISRRTNVSSPRLLPYLPAEGVKRTGAAVVVVPGGGFGLLADEHEGSDACKWLAGQGMQAYLLVHRTPTNKHTEPNLGPAQDCQRAVQVLRARASELGIDSKKIGVLGFSAGGQVAAVACANECLAPVDDGKQAVSHRPDFLLAIYAWKIYDPAKKALRADLPVSVKFPPTFIAQMGDDSGSLAQGSTLLYLARNQSSARADQSLVPGAIGRAFMPKP
ncbi:MAG: alpha/beta hydrolase [Gemmataceae bacterium]